MNWWMWGEADETMYRENYKGLRREGFERAVVGTRKSLEEFAGER